MESDKGAGTPAACIRSASAAGRGAADVVAGADGGSAIVRRTEL